MNPDEIEQNMADVLVEDSFRADENGKYHPSAASGCSLRLLLDKGTGAETTLNSWLFQGSAVHYYLQESGLMDDMLHRSGYHPVDTKYEVHTEHEIEDGISITGTCDILTTNGENTTIFDIKYSTIKPEYGHGRLMKYFSQLNTYAYMFGADEYALMMIHSKSRDLAGDGISVLTGEPQQDNWELIKNKIISVHRKLEALGWEAGETVWSVSQLEDEPDEFWKELLEGMKTDYMPAYDEECKHCDYSTFCPVKQGKVGKGLSAYKNGKP